MSPVRGTVNTGNRVYIYKVEQILLADVIGDSHPFLLSDDNAVVLQMGQRFFIINHCFMHAAWHLWPHSRVPISSSASYSSCKTRTKLSLTTRKHAYGYLEQMSNMIGSLL